MGRKNASGKHLSSNTSFDGFAVSVIIRIERISDRYLLLHGSFFFITFAGNRIPWFDLSFPAAPRPGSLFREREEVPARGAAALF